MINYKMLQVATIIVFIQFEYNYFIKTEMYYFFYITVFSYSCCDVHMFIINVVKILYVKRLNKSCVMIF